MVRLDVRLDDGGDRRLHAGGKREIVRYVLDMRIYHRERPLTQATEEIGGAACGGMEQLSENHLLPRVPRECEWVRARLVVSCTSPRSTGSPAAAHSG